MRRLLPVLLLVGIVALANELISLPASVHWDRLAIEGVAPGMSGSQIGERLGQPGERLPGGWRWPSRELELSVASGRVSLKGTRLEVGGQIVGQAGEPLSKVLRGLGPPDDWGQRCGVGTQAAVAYVSGEGKQLRVICQGAASGNRPSCCDPAARVVAFELSWSPPAGTPAPSF